MLNCYINQNICCNLYVTLRTLYGHIICKYTQTDSQTDGKTDRYFIDIKNSHYRLIICHENDRDIIMYTYMYIQDGLLKSHANIDGITYRIQIMLSGIAVIKHWIFR